MGFYIGRWIVWQRIVQAFRALRRHSQPCATCRDQVYELEAWATDWDARFTDLLGKLRAQYARTAKREKAMLDRIAEEFTEPAQNGPLPGDDIDHQMEEWRALARSRGYPV